MATNDEVRDTYTAAEAKVSRRLLQLWGFAEDRGDDEVVGLYQRALEGAGLPWVPIREGELKPNLVRTHGG